MTMKQHDAATVPAQNERTNDYGLDSGDTRRAQLDYALERIDGAEAVIEAEAPDAYSLKTARAHCQEAMRVVLGIGMAVPTPLVGHAEALVKRAKRLADRASYLVLDAGFAKDGQ